jgi:hypothetical protein
MMKILPFFVFLAATVVGCAFTINTTQAQDPSPSAKSETTTSSSTPAAAQKVDTEWEGVTVELQSVIRGEGDTIMLKWKYSNTGSKEADIAKLASLSHDNLADHVYYIDPGNKKKYMVVKDAQGKAVASDLKYFKLEAGASRGGWAKFPAPPSSVSKIDVYMPGAPPFERVTITSP